MRFVSVQSIMMGRIEARRRIIRNTPSKMVSQVLADEGRKGFEVEKGIITLKEYSYSQHSVSTIQAPCFTRSENRAQHDGLLRGCLLTY